MSLVPIYDIFKDAIDLTMNLKNVELTNALIKIQGLVLQYQDQHVRDMEQHMKDQDRIRELEAELSRKDDVIENSVYPIIMFKNDAEQIKYCAYCWHATGIKRRIVDTGWGGYHCPECKISIPIKIMEPYEEKENGS